jgi:hypothetical protein
MGRAYETAEFITLAGGMAVWPLAAHAWLMAENLILQGRPIELIQRAQGLTEVVGYLCARRS